MKRKKQREGERSFPSAILFTSGFLAGCMIPNWLWKKESGNNAVSMAYLFSMIRQGRYEERTVLYDIWKEKGMYFILAFLSGFTIFGVPLAIIGMLLLGFYVGSVLTVSILQFGFRGGAVGLAILLPQYLLYYPACCILLSGVYYESHLIRKRHGALPEKMSGYGVCILFSLSIIIAGTILEAFCNPALLRFILKMFPVF